MVMIEAAERVLILKRASASRPSGEWSDDDFDVLADRRSCRPHLQGEGGVGRFTLDVDASLRHHEDRTPTHGYAATREDAMAAFAKSWRRE
jgi:hypothetical protein